MTYFDRDQDLTIIEVSEIISVMGDSTLLTLQTPFVAELQTGRNDSVIAIKRCGDESITFVTESGEFPVARIEFNSLELLVNERITTQLFTL